MRIFKLIAVLTALFCLSVSTAQDYLTDPSIQGPSSDVKSTGPSGENLTNYTNTNRQPVNRPVTDEYGELNANRVLGTLGAAGNYVNVPFNGAFEQNVDGSVEAWIMLTAYNPVSTVIISKGATSTVAMMLGVGSGTNQLFFRIGTTIYNAGGGTIPLNQWTHVAASWTGGPNFTVVFYVNGTLTGTIGPTAATWTLASDPVRIGGSQAFTGSFLNGQIDEVKFWDDVRTAAEFRDNRFVGLGDWLGANTSGALTSSAHYSGCIASWPFNNTGSAFEDISGFDGTYTGAAVSTLVIASLTIPYNFALLCGAGNTSYVAVPSNAAFNLTTGGTVECWINPANVTGTKEIIAKSATTNTQFMFGITGAIMYMRFGTTPTQNTGGTQLVANRWYHLAWVWTGSAGNYSVTFYVNGVQSGSTVTNAGTLNNTADPVTIGNGQGFPTENFVGYIDEVRIWSAARIGDVIRANMFTSSRNITATNLLTAINFDGNLVNKGGSVASNGTFSTGGTNNCRLSGYLNETSTGAPSTSFNGHPTVNNRNISPNPFPGGFALRVQNLPLPDNATTTSTITLTNPAVTTAVEVFVSIQHTFASDLDISLTAPNGQVRDLSSDNGGGSDGGYLTFFVDGQTPITTATLLPPFSNLAAPEVAMGNMGGSATNGNWTLTIVDDAALDSGFLLGWGVRLNNTITGIEPTTNNVPNRYNLYQNYPNPFNPVSTIKFDIAKASDTKLAVYDILGREVAVLVQEYTQPGQYEVKFDGTNLASGTYFFRITSGEFTDVKKMILVK